MRYNMKKWKSKDRSNNTIKSRLEYQASLNRSSLIDEFKKVRKDLKYTQAQLAESAGISQPVLTRIETGRTNPLLGTFLLILAAMNRKLAIVPLDYEPEPSNTDDD